MWYFSLARIPCLGEDNRVGRIERKNREDAVIWESLRAFQREASSVRVGTPPNRGRLRGLFKESETVRAGGETRFMASKD